MTLFSFFILNKDMQLCKMLMETQKSGSFLSYDWSITEIVFHAALSVFQPYTIGFAEFNLKT